MSLDRCSKRARRQPMYCYQSFQGRRAVYSSLVLREIATKKRLYSFTTSRISGYTMQHDIATAHEIATARKISSTRFIKLQLGQPGDSGPDGPKVVRQHTVKGERHHASRSSVSLPMLFDVGGHNAAEVSVENLQLHHVLQHEPQFGIGRGRRRRRQAAPVVGLQPNVGALQQCPVVVGEALLLKCRQLRERVEADDVRGHLVVCVQILRAIISTNPFLLFLA